MKMAIYKAGETNLDTYVINGRALYTGYLAGKKEDIPVDEYLETMGSEYKCMPVDEAIGFINAAANNAYCKPWQEITEDQWMYALEVLPPEKWHHVDGVEIFRMSEYLTGNIAAHYCRAGKRYFTANRRTSTIYSQIAKAINHVMKY